ncbi:penicillin-binding protein 2 [Eggerthella sp. YY7918]|uniref:penicillin-binding protein 2 n=1 Tax=Eggerthella sp. (strain YY7918) TaxID=502558 RepID=UPI0002171561|nr:penicillin-binding protein 2 [Eggerthella sp. YY7918]BAK44383.1 cell division protein FtsI [Eggerthella sp. YY7918]
MLVGIIVAVATVVVALAVIGIVFFIRNRTKSSNVSVKKDVQSISSVGSFQSLGNAGTHPTSSRSGSAQRPVVNPADNLKSRFIAMGVLAAAIFGSLTAKLWSMQVLSAEAYQRKSEENRFATYATPAPRGLIYDATGVALVKNRSSLTVLADADVADDHDVIQRLSTVLGVPYNVVRQRIQNTSAGAQSKRVVASDVRLRDIAFIAEHSDAFKGVTVQTRTVREYPYGALAAHVLGYTGPVSEEELAAVPEGREIEPGDDVGKVGIEAYYDRVLSGEHGQSKVVADANGRVVEVVSETQPTKGSDIHLTIKAPVQYVCDRELAALVAPSEGIIGTGKGVGAAAVVMDVRDGGIVAMGSYPTFAPEKFIGGISQETWDLYDADEAYHPLLNRAISGSFPAASTFKAFTGLAALAYGFADTKRTWDCTGSWDGWNTGAPQHCWLLSGHGDINFRDGIIQSCDTVFYEIAKQFWENGESQGGTLSDVAMQDYIKKYGFGSTTGIDLGDETAGRIPTPEWKAENFRNQPEQAQWQGGDMTNMSIGQGYVLVTPLQMAVAYGAIATGKLMKPHLLKEVRNEGETPVATFDPVEVSTPDVPLENLNIMRDALHGLVNEGVDVSHLFAKYGIDGACKTGTAEYSDDVDTAWFACYAPFDDPKYVVTCVVEHGGGGAAVAAPVAVEMLAAALSCDDGSLTEVGPIAGSTGKSDVHVSGPTGSRTD